MANQKRDKIVETFLAILAEQPFDKIDIADIAKRAGVSLADMRGEFGLTFDMLAAFMRDTDQKVLSESDPDLAEASARERLFDVLMRRLEILKPHRAAVCSLARSARRSPSFALALNKLSLRSQQWMLAAAGIDSSGLGGRIRAQGLVLVFARTLEVWLDDDDPGLAPSMAALDRELASGERWLNLLEDVCRLVPRCGGRRARRRARPRPSESETLTA